MRSNKLKILFLSFVTLGTGISFSCSGQSITQGKSTSWHGFEKINFQLDGTKAYYVKPRNPLPGNPWVWRAHFPDWHISMDSILLSRGFYIAYINTSNEYGAPRAMMVWNQFYHYLADSLGFAAKVALEGVSRGGLYIYGWAKRNPDKVSCIYGEAPVCDFKSWPLGQGKGKGDPGSWKQLLDIYGLTQTQAIQYQDNPIDHLAGLAAFKVPIQHVISLQDKVVPPEENTFILVNRYLRLGGPASVYPMTRGPQELNGHHFVIEHPERWADFIYRSSYPVSHPLPYHDFYHIRDGLPHFYSLVTSNQPVTVAYLGGSITYNPGWRDMLSRYLKERFPGASFRFIAAGIPSLGSVPHAFRLQRDVLDSAKVDLLFLEAAVNDSENGTDSLSQIRALEGIIRHAKRSNPRMDIALFSFADPNKLATYAKGDDPVAVHNHELIAAHYDLPSINLAREVYEKIQAGEFSWQYDFKNLHPAPFGQELYFQTMKDLMDACLRFATRRHSNGKEAVLPKPMNPYNFSNGMYVPVSHATVVKGFNLVNDWTPQDKTPTRKGFVHVPVLEAATPGSELKFTFRGTAVGVAALAGPYAGKIAYSIDGGSYQTLDLHTRWSAGLYLPWYVMFTETLRAKTHILRLKVLDEQDAESKGTACRIVYFLVNK